MAKSRTSTPPMPGHRNGAGHAKAQSSRKKLPALILIGGHEDKEGEKVILREVARRIGSGKLVVTTVASHEPGDLFETYERVFRELGVQKVVQLDIQNRDEA